MIRRLISLVPMVGLVALLLPVAAIAQVTGTDLYAVVLHDGVPVKGVKPTNLTARAGYDNQPAFLADGSALRYTCIDSTGQADIRWLDPRTGQSRPLTRTATSEYSAQPIPGSDRFSVVRVEADSTQRVWSFAPSGGDPQLVLPELPGVGYHCWGDSGELIVFVLGPPDQLRRVRVGVPGSALVAEDIGRCLQRIPGDQAWSFSSRSAGGALTICRLDDATGEVTPIAPSPDASIEDYCWTMDGRLWSTDGTAVLEWRPGAPDHWRRVRDFRVDSIGAISRMTVSPLNDFLILVAADAPTESP